MEIYLDRRAVRQIRLSAAEAIEEGDNDSLREDIVDAFSDENIEEIERRIDSGDFHEFVSEVLQEWAGDEVEEVLELLEAHLADAGIDLKYTGVNVDDDEEDDEDDDEDLAEDGDDDELSIISEDHHEEEL